MSILIGPGLRPLLIGPWFRTVGRERETVRPSVGSLGLTWTVDGHVTIISNRTIRASIVPDPYTQRVGTLVFCPKGRYDLVSLIISI